MIDETKLLALRYTLERNGFAFVSRANYPVCTEIAANHDNLSRYLIGKHDINAEKNIFRAYLSAASDQAIIISDTHPITSFVVVFPPRTFSFSKLRFCLKCGLKVLLRYGFPYFGNFFRFISTSRKFRKKYTGDHSWYLAKFITGDPEKGKLLLSALLEWLDANKEVVFSDGLSENNNFFAEKQGFEIIASEKLNKNYCYYALCRKTPEK